MNPNQARALRVFREHIPELLSVPGTVLYVGASKPEATFAETLHDVGHKLTLLEIWPASLEKSRGGPFAYLVCGDVREVDTCKPLCDRYDVVFWWHGPEHVRREELAPTLAKLETMADLVVLGCPWGRYEQDAVDGNPYQAHVSEWRPKDLEELDYEIECWGPDGGGRIVAWKRKSEYNNGSVNREN